MLAFMLMCGSRFCIVYLQKWIEEIGRQERAALQSEWFKNFETPKYNTSSVSSCRVWNDLFRSLWQGSLNYLLGGDQTVQTYGNFQGIPL